MKIFFLTLAFFANAAYAQDNFAEHDMEQTYYEIEANDEIIYTPHGCSAYVGRTITATNCSNQCKKVGMKFCTLNRVPGSPYSECYCK